MDRLTEREPSPPPALKRSLSLPLVTFYALGTILGAGIYVLVGKVAASAGVFAPVAFLFAGVVAAFTGLAYAEFSARHPRSAGAAIYVHAGLRRRALSVGVGFLIIATGLVSAATLSHGFVGYLQVFLSAPDWLAIAAAVLLMGAIAAWGINESAAVAAAITVIEIVGLVFILWIGGRHFGTLPAQLPALMPPLDVDVWLGIVAGSMLAFYAFIGFEDTVNIAEEVKAPQRNLPRAIIISILVAAVLYLAVAVIAVLALPLAELTQTRAPLAAIYTRETGEEPFLISAISLFAVINGALIQIIMSARVLHGMSAEGWLPPVFARVHPRTRTPLFGTVVVTAVVLLLALALPLVTLAKATSYIILIVFALINLSLIRVKRRDPHPPGVRVYPIWVPVLGLATSAGLVVFQTAAFFGAGS